MSTAELPDPTDETAAILEQGRAVQEQAKELLSEIDDILAKRDGDDV